jgi:hypothetical protein
VLNVPRILILLECLTVCVLATGRQAVSGEGDETRPPLRNADFEEGFVEGIPKGWEFLGDGEVFPGSKQYLCVDHGGRETTPGSPEYVVHHGSFAPFDGTLVQVANTIPNARYRLSAFVNCRYSESIEPLCEKKMAGERDFWDYWAQLGYDLSGQTESFDAAEVQYPCPNLYFCNPGMTLSNWITVTTTFVARGPKTSILLRSGIKWPIVGMTCWNDVKLELLTPPQADVLDVSRLAEPLHREPEVLLESAYGVGQGLLIQPRDLNSILKYEGISLPERTKDGILICNPFGEIDLVAVIPLRVAPGRWCRLAGRILTCDLYPRGNRDISQDLFAIGYTVGPEPEFPRDCNHLERVSLSRKGSHRIEREFVAPAAASCLIMKVKAPAAVRLGLVIKDLTCTPVLAEMPEIPSQTVITPILDGTEEFNCWHYAGSGDLDAPTLSKAYCAGTDCTPQLTSNPDVPFLERLGGYSSFDGAGILSLLTKPYVRYRISFPYMLLRTKSSDDLASLCVHRAVDNKFLVALGTDTSGQSADFRSNTIRYQLLTNGKSTCKPYDFEGEFTAEGIRTTLFLRVSQQDSGVGGVRIGDVKIEEVGIQEGKGLGTLSVSEELASQCKLIRTAGVLPLRWRRLLERFSPSAAAPAQSAWDGETLQLPDIEPGDYDIIVPHIPRVRIQRDKLPPLITAEKASTDQVDLHQAEPHGYPVLRMFTLKLPCRVEVDVSGLPAGETTAIVRARCLDSFSPMAGQLSFVYGDTERDCFLSPTGEWRSFRFTFNHLEGSDEILRMVASDPGEEPSVIDIALPIRFVTVTNGQRAFTSVGFPAGPRVPLAIQVRSGAELAGTPVYDATLSSTIARLHVPEPGNVSVVLPECPNQQTPAALFVPVDGTDQDFAAGPSDEFREVFRFDACRDSSTVALDRTFPPDLYPIVEDQLEYGRGKKEAEDSELAGYLLGAYVHGPRWAARKIENGLATRQMTVEGNPANWLHPLASSTETYATRLRLLHALLETGEREKMARSVCEWHVERMIRTGLDLHGERLADLLDAFPEGTYLHDYLLFMQAQDSIRRQDEQKAVEALSRITHQELEARKQAALGLGYLGLGDIVTASTALQQVDMDSLSIREAEQALMGLASIHIMEGEYDAALKELQQILLTSTDPQVLEAAQKLLNQIGSYH